MYLTIYDFNIIYYRGTLNPIDGPNRRLNYKEDSINITQLLIFQNKLKRVFTIIIQKSLKTSREFPPQNKHYLILTISAIIKETILLQDKQIDYYVDYLTKDLVEN